MYTLKEFNEDNYKGFLHYFNVIYKYDFNIFFNVDKDTQQDFNKVKSRLSELYEDIDLDDAYFVMFALNNYLDVLNDGVYISKSSALEHEGVIVLFEDILEGVFARIKWSYLHQELSLSLQFESVKDFESEIAPDLSNLELLQDFNDRTQIVSNPEGKLLLKKKHTLNEIKYIENEIKNFERLLEENKQKLKDIDEDLSQCDEDNS